MAAEGRVRDTQQSSELPNLSAVRSEISLSQIPSAMAEKKSNTKLCAALFLLVVGLAPSPSLANGVSFASLSRTLVVSASPAESQVLVAGKDTITVTWTLNQSLPAGADAAYKKIKIKLCYAPPSQKDRAWRKTKDDLSKDKTCPFAAGSRPYSPAGGSLTYPVSKEIPSGVFFLRAYALDGADRELAYGQTTDAAKTKNVFRIEGVSGKHASLIVAASCFSAFSLASLAAFFVIEHKSRKNK